MRQWVVIISESLGVLVRSTVVGPYSDCQRAHDMAEYARGRGCSADVREIHERMIWGSKPDLRSSEPPMDRSVRL